jgi:hypothetical protein
MRGCTRLMAPISGDFPTQDGPDKMMSRFFIRESGSERIPRSLLRGKRANGEHNHSLWIEDSPQFTAESFNPRTKKHCQCAFYILLKYKCTIKKYPIKICSIFQYSRDQGVRDSSETVKIYKVAKND